MSLLVYKNEIDSLPKGWKKNRNKNMVVVFIPNTTVAEKFCKGQIFGVKYDTSGVAFLVALDKYFKDVRALLLSFTFHNTGGSVAEDEEDFVKSRTC